MSGDAVYYFCHLHTLVVDRDLDPTNEITHYQQARSPYTGLPKIGIAPPLDPVTGRAINKYPIGTALLLLPAYAGVYVSALALSAVGVPADITGYGWTYQLAAGWLTAVYAVLGLLAMIRVCQSGGVAEDVAVAATATIALGTPWLFYVTLEPLFAHALSATAVALLIRAWLAARSQDRAAWWVVTGVVGGLAAIVRYQDALFLIVPALDVLLHVRRPTPRASGARDRRRSGRVTAARRERCAVRQPVPYRLPRRKLHAPLEPLAPLHAVLVEGGAVAMGANRGARVDRSGGRCTARLDRGAPWTGGNCRAMVSREQRVLRVARSHVRQPHADQLRRLLRRWIGAATWCDGCDRCDRCVTGATRCDEVRRVRRVRCDV